MKSDGNKIKVRFIQNKTAFYLAVSNIIATFASDKRNTNLNPKNWRQQQFGIKAMLATDKQINYLCALAKKVEKIKAINSKRNVITASLPEYIDWQRERHLGVTVQDASLRISAYKNIICMSNATFVLCGISQI